MSITRLHPSQVLDQQISLKAMLPQPMYRRLVTSMYEQANEWSSAITQDPDTWLKQEQLRLEMALAFQVVPEICELIDFANSRYPENEAVTLRRELPPSEYGFCWLDKSKAITDIRGELVYVRAFTWGQSTNEDGPGVRASFYTDIHDPDDWYNRTVDPTRLEMLHRELGRLHFLLSVRFPYNVPFELPDHVDMDENLVEMHEQGYIDDEEFERVLEADALYGNPWRLGDLAAHLLGHVAPGDRLLAGRRCLPSCSQAGWPRQDPGPSHRHPAAPTLWAKVRGRVDD